MLNITNILIHVYTHSHAFRLSIFKTSFREQEQPQFRVIWPLRICPESVIQVRFVIQIKHQHVIWQVQNLLHRIHHDQTTTQTSPPRISDAMVLCFVSDIRESQRDWKRLKAETCHSLNNLHVWHMTCFPIGLSFIIHSQTWSISVLTLVPGKGWCPTPTHTHKHTQKCTLHYAFGNAPANTLVKEMDSKSEFLEKSILHSMLESIRISVPTLNLLFHVGTV